MSDDLHTPFSPPEFAGGTGAPGGADLDLAALLDISVTLSVEVGSARIPIGKLLRLGPGAVVELDRPAGEPLAVLANGTLVARGEVVLVGERYGIRLTEVVSPAQRARSAGA